MKKITMVEVCHINNQEEFADIMLRYGKLGYEKAYQHEDFYDYLFLTNIKDSLEDGDLEQAGNILEGCSRGDFGCIELSDGSFATISIE